MRYLIAAFALLCAAPCFAHSLWWVKATEYDDGTPFPPTDTVSTVVEWSSSATFDVIDGSRVVVAASSASMPDLPDGSMRYYRVRTKIGEDVSEPSEVWLKVWGAVQPPEHPVRRRPKAPTGLGGD